MTMLWKWPRTSVNGVGELLNGASGWRATGNEFGVGSADRFALGEPGIQIARVPKGVALAVLP